MIRVASGKDGEEAHKERDNTRRRASPLSKTCSDERKDNIWQSVLRKS